MNTKAIGADLRGRFGDRSGYQSGMNKKDRRTRYSLYFMTVLCVAVALASVRFIFLELEMATPDLAFHGALRPWSFYLHVGGATMALLFGPWQFFSVFRNAYPMAHRSLGILYIVGCLVGGVSGIHIGFYSPNGPVAAAGFMVLGTLWLGTTGLGLCNIVKGNIATHKRWMIRSFSLTFAAVTLRLLFPPMFAYGLEPATIFSILAWVSWMPNLTIANYFIIQKHGRVSV